MSRFLRRLLAVPLFCLAASSSHALVLGVSDAANDFLPSFTGTKNGDLDVLFAYALYDGSKQEFTFGATFAGVIGTTASTSYVWGIDRGTGTERFLSGSPALGTGVFFDAVLVVSNLGVATVNRFNGSGALQGGGVTISNNSISVVVPVANLPSTGKAFADYGWNLWPRSTAIAGNAGISDFAPNAATLVVQNVAAVPEPENYALLLAGLGLIGAIVQRRKHGRSA
jgi:hypothetical protein